MRDTATPDDGPSAHLPNAPTPQQHAAAIRAHAAEVLTRVQQWRDGPAWQNDDTNRRRYRLTDDAISELNGLPDPRDHDGLAVLIRAIHPLLAEWQPSRPGTEQVIYAAVERLQRQV